MIINIINISISVVCFNKLTLLLTICRTSPPGNAIKLVVFA